VVTIAHPQAGASVTFTQLLHLAALQETLPSHWACQQVCNYHHLLLLGLIAATSAAGIAMINTTMRLITSITICHRW
jgi:hypothetical protein